MNIRTIAAHYLVFPPSRPIYRGYLKINSLGNILETGTLIKECESTEFYNGLLCPAFTTYGTHTSHADYYEISPYRDLQNKKELPPLCQLRRQGAKIAISPSEKEEEILDEIKCINRYFPLIPIDEIIKWSTTNCTNDSSQQKSINGVILIDHINWSSMTLTKESTITRII